MKLRSAHYHQILSMIKDWRESDHGGWYYGKREQFLKRMADIEQWAHEQIKNESESE